MKINVLILMAVLFLSFGLSGVLQKSKPLSSAPAAPDALRPSEPVPQFDFTDMAGGTHSISDYSGKTIILNFWASWCAPCVTEFPHLLSYAASNPDIVLIALSSDKDRAAIETFLKRLDPDSKLLLKKPNIIIARDHDQAITTDVFQTISLPETVIIDPRQTLKSKIIGPVHSPQDLHDRINP